MKIHLIGIGGAAMGNLAAMLKQSGHSVSGSDQDLYPPMSDRLREWKIDARAFAASSVRNKDLIIVGNAISRGNVELEEALRLGLPITSMAAALQRFFLAGKKVIVVAGTHGKTTTTFLTDYLIGEAGLKGHGSVAKKGRSSRNSPYAGSGIPSSGFQGSGKQAEHLPGLFVGGVRADGHPGFRLPGKKNPYFVIEGDEYDTAFFDKASKFLHYRPHHLILTSVEFDHADIFEDLQHYKKAFRILLRWIPPNGSLIPCMADEGVRDVVKGYDFSAMFGYGKKGHSRASRKGRKVHFDLLEANDTADLSFSCEPALIGEHNTLNAIAACLVGRRLGISERQLVRGLESFPGVLRRQQIRAQSSLDRPGGKSPDHQIFMEDFAHHPTAVEKTLAAVRQAYPGYKIIALYEPRSATSHRDIFAVEYVRSLQGADLVLLPDVFNRNKVPPGQRLDVKGIVKGLNEAGTTARFCRDPGGILAQLRKELAGSSFHSWESPGSPANGPVKSVAPAPKKKGAGRRDTVAGQPSGNSRSGKHEQPVLVLAMSNGGFGGIYPEIDRIIRQ